MNRARLRGLASTLRMADREDEENVVLVEPQKQQLWGHPIRSSYEIIKSLLFTQQYLLSTMWDALGALFKVPRLTQ